MIWRVLSPIHLTTYRGGRILAARLLNGMEYLCEENSMGINSFSFVFTNETKGEFHYENAQGNKTIHFGINSNEFGRFPQFGYSNEYGGLPSTDGFTYSAATSLAWTGDREILMLVQIIDKYYGNMSARFSFKGNQVYAVFQKNAENFLEEYQGQLVGTAQKK